MQSTTRVGSVGLRHQQINEAAMNSIEAIKNDFYVEGVAFKSAKEAAQYLRKLAGWAEYRASEVGRFSKEFRDWQARIAVDRRAQADALDPAQN
jgi:hypothetical protein